MQIITVTGACNISYKILKDYHSSAQAIYEIRVKQGQPIEVEYEYEIDLEANDEEEAKEIFLNYIRKLNELGVALSAGHLAYITQHIIKFEGNYIQEEAPLDKKLLSEIELIIKLLELHEQSKDDSLIMEITHASFGKEFDNYARLKAPDLIGAATLAMAHSLFDSIKIDSHLHPLSVKEVLASLVSLDLTSIKEIKSKLISVTERAFRTQFFYTVCKTLRDYLNEYSPLNTNNSIITNDQARVIYYTCKIHNLLTVTHDVDLDAINYIRMVLKNNKDQPTMLAVAK